MTAAMRSRPSSPPDLRGVVRPQPSPPAMAVNCKLPNMDCDGPLWLAETSDTLGPVTGVPASLNGCWDALRCRVMTCVLPTAGLVEVTLTRQCLTCTCPLEQTLPLHVSHHLSQWYSAAFPHNCSNLHNAGICYPTPSSAFLPIGPSSKVSTKSK